MNKIKLFKKGGLKAQLVKGAGGSAIVQGSSLILSLITSMLLARVLGAENYGSYVFILSIVTLLVLPVKTGVPILLTREIAKSHMFYEYSLMRGALKAAIIYATVYAILVISSYLVFFYALDLSGIFHEGFIWAIWLIFLIAVEAVRTGALRGLRWVISAQAPEQILRPLTLILLIGLMVAYGAEIDSQLALQFNLVGGVLSLIVGMILVKYAIPIEISKVKATYKLKFWAKSLIPLSLFSGLKLIDAQISLILIGILASQEQVGLFRVAATGAELVAFGLTAVNVALAPQIVRLYNSGEMEKLQKVISLSTLGIAIFALPIALIFIFFGEEILGFIFGHDYIPAASALAILCLGQLVNTATGSVALMLNMTGNDKYTVFAALLSLAMCGILSFILIPKLGLNGAAIASAISLSAWNIILAVVAKNKIGINTIISIRSIIKVD